MWRQNLLERLTGRRGRPVQEVDAELHRGLDFSLHGPTFPKNNLGASARCPGAQLRVGDPTGIKFRSALSYYATDRALAVLIRAVS